MIRYHTTPVRYIPVMTTAMVPSQEALNWDMIPAEERFKLFQNLFDTVHSVLTGIGSYVQSSLFYKRFKKSELALYTQKNRRAVRMIREQEAFDSAIRVPIPTGMKSDYITATEFIATEYPLLNMTEMVKAMEITLISLTFSPQQGGADQHSKSDLAVLKKMDDKILTVKDYDRVVKSLGQIIDINARQDAGYVPIHEVFKTTDAFNATHGVVETYETYYKDAIQLIGRLNRIEKTLRDSQAIIQGRQFLDQTIMETLHDLVYRFAVHLDLSGTLLTTAQMVEHNFVLCYKAIRHHQKM